MSDLPPITHSPPVLGREVMEPETAEALRVLMASHESNPCIHIPVYPSPEAPVMGMPCIHYTFSKGFINCGPKKAQEFLDKDLLADVILQVSSDSTLLRVPRSLFFDTREEAFLHMEKSIDMLVMPDAILMRHCASKLETVAGNILEQEIEEDHPAFYNFGVFLIPPFQTSHEALERTRLLQDLKHVWRHSMDETAQKLSGEIAISDPEVSLDPDIHPLTAHDFLKMMIGRPKKRN